MVISGSGPNLLNGLDGPKVNTGFPLPDLFDLCAHQIIDFLHLLPEPVLCKRCLSGRHRLVRNSVILVLRQHGP